ncbi:TPR repeat protein [Kribbella antiqua]|uniref:TPR repeat protein n=2 Tax=Kribbella antiqua TaxID=2512217 RepID=A0A4R2I9D0_9ACTN|nr:TPR repeat protein [Kribbella antiqua]
MSFAPYPYRYPAMTRLLNEAPGRAYTAEAKQLGAALLLMAARPNSNLNFAAAAFAVLDRARADGDCPAQLNLLLLVAADQEPRDKPVHAESQRAESVCPDDPTPLWLLGQYQSQRARVHSLSNSTGDAVPGDSVPAAAQRQALDTLERLAQRFPDSAAAITGVADAHLRAGFRLAVSQPFTARHELQTAAAGYQQARSIEAPGAAAGLARALIGLGEPGHAAELARESIAGQRTPGPMLELLIMAEETAHQFGQAEAAGRQLASRGPGAYPHGFPLFAVPGGADETPGDEDLKQDPMGPQSLGWETYTTLSVYLQPLPGGAGATVEDVSFIPLYRPDGGVLEIMASCAEVSWRRNAILAGHARAALTDFPDEFKSVRPIGDYENTGCGAPGDIREIARLEEGLPVDRDSLDSVAEKRQNLWRWAGDLPRAERTIQDWLKAAGATTGSPMLRLGEVYFLQRRYDDAAAAFGAAARRLRYAEENNDLGVWQAQLDEGASLIHAGRDTEGLPLLRTIAERAERGAAYWRRSNQDAAAQFAAIGYHARAQLADAERESGAVHASVNDYEAARELLPPPSYRGVAGIRSERIDANQALAELQLGRLARARQRIESALRADPMNPGFLMTAGFIANRAGETATAVRHNAATLMSDPGAFPAANDLGVELAKLGRRDDAVTSLRRAVGIRPDYALAWFNLGVLYSQMGPRRVLESQGAFARAFALDKELVDRKPLLTIDAQIYRTGLDLSKPLPPRWSFSQLQVLSAAPSIGLLGALLLGLGLAQTAGSSTQVSQAEGLLESAGKRLGRLTLLNRLRNPLWALATTVLIFTLPAVIRLRAGATEAVTLSVGVLSMALLAMWARRLVARRVGVTTRQESWGPGVAVGVATAPLAPWAPLPVIRANRDISKDASSRIHATAPIALAIVGIILSVESSAFEVPLSRSLGTAALIMAASTLLPVAPLDGASLGKTGLVAGAGLVGAAVLIWLGVV